MNLTEKDLRHPDFQEGTPDDYERRADGKIVRKDRWQKAITHLAIELLGKREFEVEEVVAACLRLDQLANPDIPEQPRYFVVNAPLIGKFCVMERYSDASKGVYLDALHKEIASKLAYLLNKDYYTTFMEAKDENA